MIIRNIIVWTLLPPITTFFFLLALISLLLGPLAKKPIIMIRIAWLKSILLLTGIKVTTYKEQDLDYSKPHIFMSNHVGATDIPVLAVAIEKPFNFLAKQSLFNIPIVGWGMRVTGDIPIVRDNPKKAVKSLSHAAKNIHNGKSVLIFPEGTRNREATLLPFKRGGFVIAKKSEVPIVPVTIYGTHRSFENSKHLVKSHEAMVYIGKEITTIDKTEEEIKEAIRTEIESNYKKLIEIEKNEKEER